MSYKLFLDDERIPRDVTWISIGLGPWEVVRNYDEFVDTIKTHGLPSHVSFDHDLADAHYAACFEGSHNYGPEKTGYDCCKWLVEYVAEHNLKFPEYTVHSMNPVGTQNIRLYIETAKKHEFIR